MDLKSDFLNFQSICDPSVFIVEKRKYYPMDFLHSCVEIFGLRSITNSHPIKFSSWMQIVQNGDFIKQTSVI